MKDFKMVLHIVDISLLLTVNIRFVSSAVIFSQPWLAIYHAAILSNIKKMDPINISDINIPES